MTDNVLDISRVSSTSLAIGLKGVVLDASAVDSTSTNAPNTLLVDNTGSFATSNHAVVISPNTVSTVFNTLSFKSSTGLTTLSLHGAGSTAQEGIEFSSSGFGFFNTASTLGFETTSDLTFESSVLIQLETVAPGTNGFIFRVGDGTLPSLEFDIDITGAWKIGPSGSVSPGTSGQVLTSQGSGAQPIWVAPVPTLTDKQIAFGDASNLQTSNADFTWDNSAKVLLLGQLTLDTSAVSTSNLGSTLLFDNSGGTLKLVPNSGGITLSDTAGTNFIGLTSGGGMSLTSSGGPSASITMEAIAEVTILTEQVDIFVGPSAHQINISPDGAWQWDTGAGYGTTGQVLTSQGSSAAPQWQSPAAGVASFNTRTGAVTLTSGDVTTALTYTPLKNVTDTLTGTLTISGGTVTGLSAPSAASDAATKAYVDAAINGLSWKTECRFATAAALPTLIYANGSSGVGATLTGVSVGTLSIDGGTLAVNNRVLVKNQVSTFQNGIYNVTATGSGIAVFVLTRVTDMDQPSEFEGSSVFISEGSTNTDTAWVETAAVVTIGTDPVTFAQFGAGATYSAGTGLTLTTNTFSITNVGTAGTYGQVTTNAQGQVTSANVATDAAHGGTGQTSYTKGDLLVASGSTTLAKLAVGTNGQSLIADSTQTDGVKWASPFVIGQVVQSPSAPVDGGTWLACDGSAQSQSTYASLFSALGQGYFRYTGTLSASNAIGTVPNALTWTGTNWLVTVAASTTTKISTTGTTWSAGGTLNAAQTGFISTDANGKVLVYSSTSTAANYSSNNGSTWAASTFAATGAWQIRYNGTNWVGVKVGSTNVMHSSDGVTWTQTTSALPTAPGSAANLFWDGSTWLLVDGNFVLTKTTTSDGSAGWSLVTVPSNGFVGGAYTINGSTIVAAQNSPLIVGTLTSQFATTTYGLASFPVGTSSNKPFWNGFCYVIWMNTGNGPNLACSLDGLKWNYVGPPFSWFSPGGLGTTDGSAQFMPSIDTATGKWVFWLNQNYSCLLAPVHTPSTQFCLPYQPGSFIKAL